MKRKFFDTKFALYAGIPGFIPRVLKYAVENQYALFSTADLMRMIQPIRTILKTPMAELFARLVDQEQLSNFAAYSIKTGSTNIPEVLTASNITLDFKQIPDASAVSNIPSLNNKVYLNLTTVLKSDRTTGGYEINAVDNFFNFFVRGQLVAGYYDSDNWLNPTLAEYVIKSYSMILSAQLSRYYNLTLAEQLEIAGIFALFYAQLLSPDGTDNVLPPVLNRCTFIGNLAVIRNLAEDCADISKDGLTIDGVCELIRRRGPVKIKEFDDNALFAICGNLGPDLVTSRIAMEYPPYWVYCLVLALSGAKIPLIYQLNNEKLANEGKSRFLKGLMSSETVFQLSR